MKQQQNNGKKMKNLEIEHHHLIVERKINVNNVI